MNEIKKRKCSKCDLMNNDIPISKKRPLCKTLNELENCDLNRMLNQIENRIKYYKGEISATYYCTKDGLFIDDYTE